jgi:hypothetical protein
MPFSDSLYNCKAKACAAAPAIATGVGAIERLKYFFLMLGVNARSIIVYA